jgi:monofunctional glycosyltransferase
MATKKTTTTKNYAVVWAKTKIALAIIFAAHFIWFCIYAYSYITDQNIDISITKTQLGTVIVAIAFIAIAYFVFLKKYVIVNKILFWAKQAFFIFYGLSLVYTLYLMAFNPPITITQIWNALKGHGLTKQNIWYSNMGKNIKLAAIASEDQLFPDHDGFDIKGIKLAMKYNKRHPGRPPRGASTISQQTAKNVFLFQGGGFLRKAPEMFYTFTIEQLWSKRTILEHYLNIAETGTGIYGVEAAANTYFNKAAKDLTRQEAAQIIATLPNPKVYTIKPMHPRVAARYPAIVRQMAVLDGDADVKAIVN